MFKHTPSSLMRVTLWFLAWVVLIDVGLNLLGAVAAPRSGGIGALGRYLEYGRSVEGKLAAILGAGTSAPNSVVAAGWLDPMAWKALPAHKATPDQTLVAVYGQSFAFRALEHARSAQPKLVLRKIGGPAAPLSHSYAAYQLDKGSHQADVVVIGVLASAIGKSGSISGLAFSFENPTPFTFPSYSLQNGQLVAEAPELGTEKAFRSAFAQRGEAWARFAQQLHDHNPSLDGFTFQQSVLDRSALIRLARRGWVSSKNAELPSTVADQLPLAARMLTDISQHTRATNARLIVLLLQDKGSDPLVSQSLAPLLRARGIAVVDSADFINPKDPRNFVSDGHFTPEGDKRLAKEVLHLIEAR